MASKAVQRLATRLERDHGVIVNQETFSRTRAGYWQRKAGVWSWQMMSIKPELYAVGSQQPLSVCASGRYWLDVNATDFRNIEIDAYPIKEAT